MGKARVPYEGVSPLLTDPGDLRRQGCHLIFLLPVQLQFRPAPGVTCHTEASDLQNLERYHSGPRKLAKSQDPGWHGAAKIASSGLEAPHALPGSVPDLYFSCGQRS